MKVLKFEIDKSVNGQYLVRVRARNGEIVLSGETTKRKALRMIENVIEAIDSSQWRIVDLTEEALIGKKKR